MHARRGLTISVLFVGLVVAGAREVSAQPVEVVGTRALGMAGAFVAVADDASAVYWNPAGLASAGLFGAQVDFGEAWSPRGDVLRRGVVTDDQTWLVAMGAPPLGLAFYKLRHAGVDVGAPVPPRPGDVAVARLDTQHVAVNLLQAVGEVLVVGGTLKYVQGHAETGVLHGAATPEQIRDQASNFEGPGGSAFDSDFGVHAVLPRVRLGLLARNLFEPSFETSDGVELELPRQLRVGVAAVPIDDWFIAVDADLLEAKLFTGTTRMLAIGSERWLADRRFGVRGGVRFSTFGDAHLTISGGASARLGSVFYVEGFGTVGDEDDGQAWGVSFRVAY